MPNARTSDFRRLAVAFWYHAVEFLLLVGGCAAGAGGFGLMFFVPATSPMHALGGGALVGLSAWMLLQWVRRYGSGKD